MKTIGNIDLSLIKNKVSEVPSSETTKPTETSSTSKTLYFDGGVWDETDAATYVAHFWKDGGAEFGDATLVKGNQYYSC
ncbi:MAG: hypothetical protein MJ111_01240, partial [Clostridia bacterium]|nr:hypothetical protein [Clostridia bacterium]